MSATPEPTTSDFAPIDLDAERSRRAAEREANGQRDQPIIVGGNVIAILPVELPIDVLAPIRDLDEDIALLLRQIVKGAQENANADAMALAVDLIATNPKLPMNVLDTISGIAKNLFGDEGFDALIAAHLTREDLGYLAKSVMAYYGISLGESSPSSDSPTDDGTTSSSTSSENSVDSTPDASGDTETPELASTPTT